MLIFSWDTSVARRVSTSCENQYQGKSNYAKAKKSVLLLFNISINETAVPALLVLQFQLADTGVSVLLLFNSGSIVFRQQIHA